MLIWRFAAGEAERSEHEFIEPEHFVQAMTRGESLTDDAMLRLVISDEAERRATAAKLAIVQGPAPSRHTGRERFPNVHRGFPPPAFHVLAQ